MDWLTQLLTNPSSFTHNLLVYMVVISIGLYLGRLKFRGISLGATFVLFTGLIAGHLGVRVSPETLTFMRNFGLVLFIFFIGLQVGPSFFGTLRSGGLRLNAIMISVIVMNLILTVLLWKFSGIPFDEMLGVMFGAVTSTPGLGAAQETLSQMGTAADITIGYACAYPFGILGMIGCVLLLKKIFNVDPQAEDEQWEKRERLNAQTPIYYHIDVTNQALNGLSLREIRSAINRPFICSRVLHDGVLTSPTASSKIHCGDQIRVVSNPEHKFPIVAFCGNENTSVDLASGHSPLVTRLILVTDPKVHGTRLEDLHLSHFDGANITRLTRAGMTLFPYNQLRLQLGDTLFVVGPENAIKRLAAVMGNKERELERPNVIAIFAGIAAGLILGVIPLALPGMASPISLGVAGGSLIAAILLGHFGPRFHLVTYTTNSASLMLREWGQTFFLASIGLGAGAQFFAAFLDGNGLLYAALGIPITVIPMLAIGIFCRKKLKMNFHTIAGLIAGCATNSAILGFVSGMSSKGSAVVAYSSVYPLAMFLRILSGQLLIMLFWSAV